MLVKLLRLSFLVDDVISSMESYCGALGLCFFLAAKFVRLDLSGFCKTCLISNMPPLFLLMAAAGDADVI